MPHPEFKALMDAEADGELGREDLSRLEEHLVTCAECGEYRDTAQRESALLREALTHSHAGVNLGPLVMARVTERPAPAPSSLRRAMAAGIAGNLITAVILVLLSVGTQASLALMLVIAVVGAILWGGIKGLAFGRLVRYLPGNVVLRGLIFGAGLWGLTNLLLAVVGGLGASSELAPTFIVTGSLIHDVIYGLLISAFYSWLARETSWQRAD